MPGPERLPLGGADNFVHLLFCHLAAHRYVVLPWWFQPTETQTGPLTQDDALINPPTAIDGSGRVIEPVEVAATAVFERGVTETAVKIVKVTAALKSTERMGRLMRSLYRRWS